MTRININGDDSRWMCDCSACTALYLRAATLFWEGEQKRGAPESVVPAMLVKNAGFRAAVMSAYLAGRASAAREIGRVANDVAAAAEQPRTPEDAGIPISDLPDWERELLERQEREGGGTP